MDPVVLILAALVVLAVVVLTVLALRGDHKGRGSEPGTGYHTLRSDYQSGVGGGNMREWRVPRDPQDYAKLFVPKDKRK